MTDYVEVIALWPSLAALAQEVGLPYQTVAAWRYRRRIPARCWPAVIAAARRRGIKSVTEATLLRAEQRRLATQPAPPTPQGA